MVVWCIVGMWRIDVPPVSVLNGHSKKKCQKIVFQNQLSLNADQKYCKMHSAILSTVINLPIVIEICDLYIFEWPFYTLSGFTCI